VSAASGAILVGLIADTHGLMRPEALEALAGVSLILHAGDVGGEAVLDALAAIAPTEAVRGNTDPPDARLAARIDRVVGGVRVHVSHGHELGSPTPKALLAATDADVIVYGHTHVPLLHRAAGRLVVNPGAAGARRFRLLPSVARVTIVNGAADAEIIALGR
jgi:uncharacterized protein